MLGYVRVGSRYLNLAQFAQVDVEHAPDGRRSSQPTGVALYGPGCTTPSCVLRGQEADELRSYLASLDIPRLMPTEFGGIVARRPYENTVLGPAEADRPDDDFREMEHRLAVTASGIGHLKEKIHGLLCSGDGTCGDVSDDPEPAA